MRKKILPWMLIVLLAIFAFTQLTGCRDISSETEVLAADGTAEATQETAVETEATAEPVTEAATEPSVVPETEAAAETTTEPATEPSEGNGQDYVLNTNTMKFHYPSCSSADKIKEKNKAYFHGTRDELIEKGFDPCGRCHP